MEELVSSAVVQETVSQIISGLVHNYKGKEKSNANENLERLEMAHIKLEAALETSNKWLITDASLLRWRKKLKYAAQACDDTLHKCKQRIIEEEQMDQDVRNSSFPKRIAHAAKSLIFSTISHNNGKLSRSDVQRFEWYADGASEFLRFIELGGTPRRHMSFDPMVRHLLTGQILENEINRGDACTLFLLWVPFITEDHGIEASLVFMSKSGNNVPEDNFFLSVMLQISEATDIVGIVVKCLQLFEPLFNSTVENIRKELVQLPTQDLSWVPYVDSRQKEHWDNLHRFGTQWFRPNPLCCKQRDLHEVRCSTKADISGIPDVSLEPIIEVNLQCEISPSVYNRHRASWSKGRTILQDPPHLKAGLLFMPHGSSGDLLPLNTRSAAEMISGDVQLCLHTDIALQHLEEIILPKAIDYIHKNAEASIYQILWKSKHSTAYIQVETASMKNQSRQRTVQGDRKRKLLQREDQMLENRTHVIPHFLDLWVAHAPISLQGSIMDWIQKAKEELMPQTLHMKF
ncbi:unnamed protein product [Urochloa decumbens]|uniref:Rx N-terminal domain-containing protein n=1 Tax=Urochloa decumbens TaxID=240449 RepID=A0ABC9FML8_9POAL